MVFFSTALVTAQEQTEVGTPRATTLIVDQLGGRINNPTQTNPYQAGTHMSAGLHQLVYYDICGKSTRRRVSNSRPWPLKCQRR